MDADKDSVGGTGPDSNTTPFGADFIPIAAHAAILGLLAGTDPLLLCDELVRSSAVALSAERAGLALLENERVRIVGMVRSPANAVSSDEFARTRRWTDMGFLTSHPLVHEALVRRKAVTGRALDLDRTASDSASLVVDLQHIAVAPFFLREELVGTLSVSRGRDQPFDANSLATLQGFADLLALVQQNSRLQSESERSRVRTRTMADRLRHALDAARDIAGLNTVEAATHRVLTRAAQATGATHGFISLVIGQHLAVEFDLESDQSVRGFSRLKPIAESLGAARAIAERATVVAFFPTAEEAPIHQSGSEVRAGSHALFCPLLAGGEILGMLELRREDRGFAADDIAVLDHFASVAALLLRSARHLQEARAGAEAKTRFLNLAAHELRTPLSVMRGYLSLIEDHSLTTLEGVLAAVDVLRRKTDELNELIESILLAARLDAGAVRYDAALVDLNDLVRAAVERLQPQLQLSQGIQRVEISESPIWVLVDPASIAKVLDNLLANSIAYSAGPPKITVVVHVSSEGANVIVEDHGSGIPEADQAHLFERFFRSSTVTPHIGSGLGLAVGREFARAAGGALELLWSRQGEGSAFRLRLPLAPASETD